MSRIDENRAFIPVRIAVLTVSDTRSEADDKSGIIWASATLALCIACLFLIPLPFIRIFIAFILGFVLMTASNIWAK